MYTVTVNGRIYPVNNPKMFVHKLHLTRNASVTWHTDGNCTIVDNPMIERPLVKLSSDIVTTIKEG